MKLRFFGSLVHRAAGVLALCAPPALAVSFSTDFAAGNPAGSVLRGHATVTGGALVLTAATQNQLGSWVLDDFTGGRDVAAFEASLTILMGSAVGPVTGADGFSFNWATDLPATAFDEEGAGTGLTVAFDTFDNGGGEAPAIDVKWNGAVVAHSVVPFDFSAAANAAVPVTVSLMNGRVTVTFNGVVAHSGVALPGFTWLTGAQFGLGARTGGLFERHFVNDLSLTVPEPVTRRVAAGGTDAGDCTTGDCATVNYAIGQSLPGDTVELAAGTYTEPDILVTKDLTLRGAGTDDTILQAATAPRSVFHRVMQMSPGVTATLENLTLRHGWSDYGGGLLASSGVLTLNGVAVADNEAEEGGGLYLNADNGGLTLTLNNCVIRDNVATPTGGNAGGGGLILQGHHSTVVTLVNTTFSGNQTTGDGGGIYSRTFGTGNLTLSGCTLHGNTAGLSGGGLWTEHNWDVNLHQTTVSGNQAANNGGGYYLEHGYLSCAHSTLAGNVSDSDHDGGGSGGGLYRVAGVAEIRGSLIAGNRKGPNAADGGADVGGNVTSFGHNLTGSGTGFMSGNGDLTVPPSTVFTHVIGPLANNGGSTWTHAPLAGSPAIGHGHAGGLPADLADLDGDGDLGEPVPFDQRGSGFPRVLGTRVDIGAVESELPGLLAAYVAPAAGFTPANPAPGDAVTWNGPGGPVSGLVFGLHASSSLRAAITAAADGGTVKVAAGTYTEPGLVVNTSLNLIGAGADATFIEAAATPGEATDRVLFLNPGLSLTLAGCTLRHGKATEGGGLFATTGSLTLNDVVLADNEAGRGGGLFAWADTAALTLTLNRCVVRDNRATVSGPGTVGGGGLYVQETVGRGLVAVFNDCAFADNEAVTGAGGVFTGVVGFPNGAAAATFRRCTFSGNHAGTDGGGLEMVGATLLLDHCTVSGNRANGNGGGLFTASAPAALLHCTVADNTADADASGGGVGGGLFGAPSLRGSLLAGNRVGSDPAHASADVFGSVFTLGHNLAGSGTGFPADDATDVFVNPATVFTTVLAPLADNGGPLLTHALPVTSPAINAALNANLPADAGDLDGDGDTAEPLPYDVRGVGFPRVIGGVPDIGAVEGPSPYAYVDAAGDFTPANPAAGDLVTWQGPGGPVPGLVFGREAFTGIQTALQEMAAGGWLALAAGTYTEPDLTVDRDVTITGAGAESTIVQAAATLTPADHRVFFIQPEVTATLEALTIRHGWTQGDGGGVYASNCNLTLNDVTLADNHSSGHGGGLSYYSDSGSRTLTFQRCRIQGNEALAGERGNYGGGIRVESEGGTLNAGLLDTVITGNQVFDGGGAGLFCRGVTGTFLTLNRCRVSDNVSDGSASGGGLVVTCPNNSHVARLDIHQTTFSGNTAGSAGGLRLGRVVANLVQCTVSGNRSRGLAGGIHAEATSCQLTLRHCTVADNQCDLLEAGVYYGGGLYLGPAGSVSLQGCIVAGNRQGPNPLGATADFYRSHANPNLISLGHNLTGTGTGFPTGNATDLFVDPATIFTTVLSPLADHGGPTPTHALPFGSPALEAGSNAELPADTADLDGDGDTAEPLPLDQRGVGFPRVLGAAVDLGAFEAVLFPVLGQPDTFHRQPRRTIKIPLAALLANDLTPASHPLTVTTVSAVSAGGVPLQMVNGVVLYAPATGFNETDTFTYTAGNGLETVTVTVTVVVDAPAPAPTLNLTSTSGTPGFPGQVIVNAAGIPGRRYALQATGNLTPPVTWTPVSREQTAGEDGRISFTEENPPSPRFYRVVEVELP